MIWQEKTAGTDDIYEILREPSDVTRAELECGGGTMWQALKALSGLLRTGVAETLLIDGEPVVMLGHNAHPSYKATRITWFVAKQKYFDLGLRGVRFGRNYMLRARQNWRGFEFESYTWSEHPMVSRWFKALGYAESPRTDLAPGCRLFQLKALPKTSDLRSVS